jgi:PEP-CTERM putative exosortase interaction domain
MKRYTLTTSFVAAILSVFTTSGYAQLTTTTYADQATWNLSTANNYHLTDQTTLTPQSVMTVNSGGASAGISNNIFAQTFTPTTTFTLGAFSIYAAGGPVTGASVHLFQVTSLPNGLPGGWATTGGFNILQNANTNDMFNPGNTGTGLTFNYNGVATQNYLEFDLAAANQVTLTAGASYAFEIWAPSSTVANALFWRRGGDVYVNGNIYGANLAGAGYSPDATQLGVSMNNVAGGVRDGALALYAVPEPASLTLLGLASVALFLARRRK